MTGRVFIFVGLLVLVAARPLWAQSAAPQVQVRVERNTVTVGEPFWARITVASESGSAMVSLPPGSPFELLSRGGTSTSFQMQSSFGGGMQVTHSESVSWQLRANRPGRQTLGPMIVTVGGQQYQAGAVTMEVVQGSGGAPSPAPQQPGGSWLPPSTLGGMPSPSPMPSQPAPPTPGGTDAPGAPGSLPGQIDPADLDGAVYDGELFIRTVIEPEEAYVGQQVILSVYIYTTLQLANVSVTREASTDGFWSEDLLGPTRRLSFEDQFIGQNHFRVALLRRSAVFPLREGELTIGAPQLEATTAFRSIFSGRGGTIARQGVPVQLRARPLPEEGRPDGFESGNVGVFDVRSSVDQRSTKVGEPITLTVTVSGSGHLRNVKLPPLGELEGARVYEPRTSDAVSKQGGRIGGERRWEYLILPQKSGTLEIPAITLSYFDPEAESYLSKSSQAHEITVSEGAAGSNGVGSEGEDGAEAVDQPDSTGGELAALHTIRRQSGLSTGSSQLYDRWWFFVLVLIAPLGFITLVVIERVRGRRAANQGVVKAKRAAQVARKALGQIDGGNEDESLAAIMRAMNGFFVDRFGKSVSGQTMEELRGFLGARGAEEALSNRVVELLHRCERGRFAGGGERLDGGALAAEASDLVAALDELSGEPAKGARR
jgi:hypothetical protein